MHFINKVLLLLLFLLFEDSMTTVKVLTKGQITLPKKMRDALQVHEGDTLIVEEKDGQITLKKAKTIFDLVGVLPDLGIPIDEMIEQAIKEEYGNND